MQCIITIISNGYVMYNCIITIISDGQSESYNTRNEKISEEEISEDSPESIEILVEIIRIDFLLFSYENLKNIGD